MRGIGRQEYLLIIAGFVQGISLPVIEMIVAALVSAGTLFFAQETVGSFSTLLLTFMILLTFDLIRNVSIALFSPQLAKGNIIGNVLGILIFYASVNSISQEAAIVSLLFTSVFAASLIIGIIIYSRTRLSKYKSY